MFANCVPTKSYLSVSFIGIGMVDLELTLTVTTDAGDHATASVHQTIIIHAVTLSNQALRQKLSVFTNL
jgi:hypothetical protein